jgi:CRP-like cAMP-binding protein
MQKIPHLHDFISDLEEPVRQAYASRCRSRTLARGEPVYRHGDPSVELYQIVSGGVKLVYLTSEGREFVAPEFRAGDCFGEMGLIDGLPRVSHAVAVRDTTLRVLSLRDFQQLSREFPEFERQCLLMNCRRLRFAYNLLAEFGGLALHERLIMTLCRQGLSHGTRDGDGGVYIAISQEEMGRMLGVSRQTINKELNGLLQGGSIELRYGKVYIGDLEAFINDHSHLMSASSIAATYDEPG